MCFIRLNVFKFLFLHVINKKLRYFAFYICKLFTFQYVFYTYSTFQFGLAIFQALDI